MKSCYNHLRAGTADLLILAHFVSFGATKEMPVAA
jgi:hypothetical protein